MKASRSRESGVFGGKIAGMLFSTMDSKSKYVTFGLEGSVKLSFQEKPELHLGNSALSTFAHSFLAMLDKP